MKLTPRSPGYNVEGSVNAHLGFDFFVFSEHLQNLRVNIVSKGVRGCTVYLMGSVVDEILN